MRNETTGTGAEAAAPGLRLTEDELHGLLGEAMARQDAARTGAAYTLEDALKVARELDIPVEHVHAAAERWRRREHTDTRRHAMRLRLQRNRRRAAFVLTGMGLFCMGFLGFSDPANGAHMALLASGPVAAAIFLWRFPVTDAEVDRCLSVTPDE